MEKPSRRDLARLIGGAGAASLTLSAGSTFAIAQSAARIVIVGGGAGGATVAHYLLKDRKAGDPKLDVTLIEANPVYSSSFFSNLYLGGFRDFASLNHGYDGLRRIGVRVVHDYATAVDTAKKIVRTRGGRTYAYDRLVLSPGIDIKYESIPGYSLAVANQLPHGYNTSAAGKLQLRAAMERMRDGGTFLMVMPNNPFRCPPGPYERACMIAHYLKTRKPKSKLVILDPKRNFSKQPVFEEAFQKYYKDIIELNLSNDIDDFTVTALDVKGREVTTKAGKKVKFDAANIIPAQRAGEIAIKAGLTKGDWVAINPENFSAKEAKDVYVIGDATIAAEMPKSAFSANSQAKAVVADILADVAKKEKFPARYRNTCWSLVAPDDCIKIGANYAPKDGKLDPSGGFVSQKGEDAATRKQNYQESIGWYAGITADMFAKVVAPPPKGQAGPAKKG
jgi:NADPH-dependent 2,4-dienoyl-CoA reductase/sulfur reductase-like enzyme